MTFGFKAAICVVLTFLVCSCVTGPDVLDLYIDGKSKEIIDLYEQGEAKERDRTSRDDFYLCQAYLKAKRYDKLNCPLEFTEKYKRADLKRSELFLYAERAHMLIDLGRYHDAAKDAQIAIGLLESDFWGDEKPLAISAYAMAQAYLGNEKEAIAYVKEIEEYKPAMSTFSATSTNISKDEALARVYMALGRYKDVIRVSERSKFDVGVGEVLFGPFAAIGYATNDKKHQAFLMRSREYIPFTFMLAKAYYETLNMEKAEYGFKAVLSFPSISSYGSIHWISLANLGMIRLSQDSPSEAIRLLKKAVDVIEWQRTTISVEASRIGFVGDKQSVYRNLVKVLFKKQRYAEAFEYVERAKARAR